MKKIALTFDDGPSPKTTQKILDILKQYDAVATFMLQGNNTEKYPELAKAIAADGHEIGNHTFNHANLTSLSPAEINEEISKTDRAIADATGGIETHIIRAPFGSYNDDVIDVVDRPIIMWSVDSTDWDPSDPTHIRNAVVGNTQDGDIVLFHDWVEQTVDVLNDIMSELVNEGTEFVTVSDLMGHNFRHINVVTSRDDVKSDS